VVSSWCCSRKRRSPMASRSSRLQRSLTGGPSLLKSSLVTFLGRRHRLPARRADRGIRPGAPQALYERTGKAHLHRLSAGARPAAASRLSPSSCRSVGDRSAGGAERDAPVAGLWRWPRSQDGRRKADRRTTEVTRAGSRPHPVRQAVALHPSRCWKESVGRPARRQAGLEQDRVASRCSPPVVDDVDRPGAPGRRSKPSCEDAAARAPESHLSERAGWPPVARLSWRCAGCAGVARNRRSQPAAARCCPGRRRRGRMRPEEGDHRERRHAVDARQPACRRG
jgi:hypothetical protein